MKFPFVTLAAAVFSAPPTVTSLRVVPTEGHAAVVIGVEASVGVQDFTLDAPNRVVVDLKGATLTGPVPTYDRIERGGITDVRVSELRANTIRVVIQLDSVHAYAIQRDAHELRIEINATNTRFSSWTPKLGGDDNSATVASDANVPAADAVSATVPADATATSVSALPAAFGGQPSRQPRITVNYQDADIHDVLAAFATFSGRTIVVGRDVTGTVTAEIRNQPWNVAMRAILQGQGLAASEDPASGIITVDSYANILAKQALEPLVTQVIPINYTKADSLVPVISKLLARDCQQVAAASAGNPASQGNNANGGGYGGVGNCITRGAVASAPATNSIIVTETASRMADILSYIRRLDIRTPQVQIKAKIIFVDRTSIENLGLSYDFGTNQQFFTQLVQRIDPSTEKPVDTNGDGVPDALGGGTPFTANQIFIGGNTLSAIANANNRVTSPALSLIYSAALGKFSLTSFLDALREVQLADLQAEPSIMTVDNKEAQIQVGQDVPVRVIDEGSVGTVGAGTQVPRATVSFKHVGIILNVTPHITNNGQVVLDVHAENSNAQLASSDVGYVFNEQIANNRLLVQDGETAVIGGLTVTQVTQDKTGIPLLVDLPVIGRLFGTTNRSEEKRDLLILITPHIVDTDNSTGQQGH